MTGPDRETVELLAEEFAERYRRGERVSVAEYAAAHPEHADEIRDLFPALVLMEELAPSQDDPADALSPSPADEGATAPARIGDYRILREVGRGGMGVVYEAVQESLGRHVALKVLPPGVAVNPSYLERFRREARSAARLHHSHIVPVFGVGASDGVHYYAMQFIAGQGLDTVLNEVRRLRAAAGEKNSLPFPTTSLIGSGGDSATVLLSAPGQTYCRSVARIGLQVAEALGYAHQVGIVHRDIKPGNLLLDSAGEAWVTDFGLARIEDGLDLTNTGEVVGTLRYRPPERFQGVTDPRGDVYSLGLTLYEMLTLRPAFDRANRAELLRDILHEPPVPPRRIDPSIPRDLETIVLKAIEKNPADRFAGATEMAEELRRFLADETLRIRPAGPIERLNRWRRHNPVVAALIAAVAILLLVGSGGGAVLSLYLWSALETADQNFQKAVAAEREKTKELWDSRLEQARAGRSSGRVGQRLGPLRALAQAAAIRFDERLRDEAIAALALPDLRPGPRWTARTPTTLAIAFDGHYRLYARADNQHTVSVRRVSDAGEVRRITSDRPGNPVLSLSPDGRFLLRMVPGDSLAVWRVDDGKVVVGNRAATCWDFSPDGRLLALGAPLGGEIQCIHLDTGGVAHTLIMPATPGRLVFHPDSRRLAVAHTGISVCDVTTGKTLAEIMGNTRNLIAWHPDGRRLALGAPAIEIWDTDSPQHLMPLMTIPGHAGEVTALCFHPDGDYLATASQDGTVRLWDATPGRQLLQATGPIVPRFSPDGRWFGVSWHEDEAELLEMVPSREFRTLPSRTGPGGPGFGDVSADGRLVAFNMAGGTHLWDLAGNRELAVLPPGGMRVRFAEHDGRFELLAGSALGLLRWPITTDGGRLRIGPPRELSNGFTEFAVGPDGRTVVGSLDVGVAAFDLEHERTRGQVCRPWTYRRVALSPDGRLVMNSGTDVVQVWDVARRRLVRSWGLADSQSPVKLGPTTEAVFTPDGRAVVFAEGDGYSFWDARTWTPIRRLRREVPGSADHVAFTPDGRLMAAEMEPAVVHLVEVETGRTVARLTNPHADRPGWMAFTPDGAKLISASGKAVHVWDLRTVREQLKPLGLDWDWPEFSPTAAARPVTSATVDIGYLEEELTWDSRAAIEAHTQHLRLHPVSPEAYLKRAALYERLKKWKEAVDDWTQFLALAPRDDPRRAVALFRRAALSSREAREADLLELIKLDLGMIPWPWKVPALLSGTAWERVRDGNEKLDTALVLARKAVELSPDDPVCRRALGAALYWKGQLQEAIAMHEANAANPADVQAIDLYLLARAYHALRDRDRSQDYLGRARLRYAEQVPGLPAAQQQDLDAIRAVVEGLVKEER